MSIENVDKEADEEKETKSKKIKLDQMDNIGKEVAN